MQTAKAREWDDANSRNLTPDQHDPIAMSYARTAIKNGDKRPMGFRWWDVAAKGKMVHRFVPLEGMDE